MYALKDAYRLHTECIQAYKKSKREKFLFHFFFILPVLLSSTARGCGQSNFSLFASSGMYEYRRPIRIAHRASLPVPLGRIRPQFMTNHMARDLYALYASKNRLCMLCENTTPELTAYNAYRNANRRVRRAESTKMYAVGDAYKVHTECIQAYKKSKREKFLFHFFFILPVLLSSTARDFRHSSSTVRVFRHVRLSESPIRPHCLFL